MPNGNPLNALEHNGIPPDEYSISDYQNYFPNMTDEKMIEYLPSDYNSFQFKNYAGNFYMQLGNVIALPDDTLQYQGIAPYNQMPEIVTPKPYER